MSLLQNSNAIPQLGGYNLTDSLRFRESASAYLSRTPATASNRQTWTWSAWVKRGNVAASSYYCLFGVDGVTPNNRTEITFSSNAIFIYEEVTSATISLTTTGLFRDPSAWYHIVVAIDTTQATSTNRVKLYVNGEQITSFSSATYPSLNYNTFVNSTNTHVIGARRYAGGTVNKYFDGYLTEVNLVDGQALTPSDFGEYNATTSVWKPKKYTGTYGTNGFYLPLKPTTQATGFNTVLYTGNGTSQSIDGVGFAPDFVWVKNRDQPDSNHLYDTVRGAYYRLISDNTAVDAYSALQLSSFNADGFSYGSAHAGNASGEDYVAWCWDAGSSTVSNTDGDITASVRANPATGFSIVTYDPTPSGTVGHGLSTAPELIIEKKRDTTGDWIVGTTVIDGSYDYLRLNTTAAAAASGVAAPTATVFTPNVGGDSAVAYCFTSVEGYSKIGSYTGNGTSQSINLGFRPAFVMWKRTDAAGNSWIIKDNTRYADNQGNLFPNVATTENTDTSVTFTDTGFDVDSSLGYNGSGREFIYMAFADTRDFQWNFDASGNKNNWTANNINSNASSDTTYDIMSDVPTLTDEDTANFATLNPLDHFSTNVDFSEANLKYTVPAGSYTNGSVATSTITMTSGKWYCEMTALSDYSMMGVAKLPRANMRYLGDDVTGYGYYTNGSKYNNAVGVSYGASFTINDIIGVALDLDAGTLTFYKNGVSQGTAFTGLSGEFVFATGNTNVSNNAITAVNFGQRPFAYTPPAGYLKLNTYNLPDSAIKNGSQYFGVNTWSGDSTSPRVIVNQAQFKPDLVWVKGRNGIINHVLIDSVRGTQKNLISNSTSAEVTSPVNGSVSAFNSNGFSVITGTSDTVEVNYTGYNYVGWQWKAGGTAVSNTDGTITSQVSANTTAGFSVVTYTGTGANATVGHGLGAAPNMMIIKNRTSANSWPVYHSSLGNTQLIVLDLTNAASTSSVYWNNTSPTTSVFTIGTAGSVNTNTSNYVAYCFAEVEGFSKFGSYTGNGSTDGTFVYTGFRPAFVIIKKTDSSEEHWYMFDDTRSSYNGEGARLKANVSDSETTNNNLDILSNGFKNRLSGTGTNGNGSTYIYMAFAENPFKNSLAR